MPASYNRGRILILLFIAGMGGFLYGYDIGIIGAALLYLDKTINLTLQQKSLIVGAVLGGGMFSSLVAGIPAEIFGRKKVMICAAVMFVASVALIIVAHGFVPLFLGRGLQGLSAGMIAVVIPLHLAEGLPASIRGRGTAFFQWTLTVGIMSAFYIGSHYTDTVAAGVTAGVTGDALLRAEDHAWRWMFVSSIYPAVLFLVGTFFVIESPRWLFRKGRPEQALAVLRKSLSEVEAGTEFREMSEIITRDRGAAKPAAPTLSGRIRDGLQMLSSLAKRKYIVPFLLACAVLGLTQATGVNSLLQYVVVILQQAGLDAAVAARSAPPISAVNCVFTILGFFLVDRLGRKGMLMIGTAGITISLLAGAYTFHQFESQRVDVTGAVSSAVAASGHSAAPAGTSLDLTPAAIGRPLGEGASQLVVLYSYTGRGGDEWMAYAHTRDAHPTLSLPADPNGGSPVIKRATYGPAPSHHTGRVIMFCIMLFMGSFATGPGVCVWLALTELMPTRIRSIGMGVGLMVNQAISTGIAALFLPFVGHYGYTSIFLFWAFFTLIFFLVAAFLLPETKGKTLEEIEAGFEG